MGERFTLVAVIGVASLIVSALPASSQITAQAQLNGYVRDYTGAFVAKAAVTATQVDTNRVNTAASNERGYYIFTNLQPGRYELAAELTDFAKFRQRGIVLAVGDIATVNITLMAAEEAGKETVVDTEVPAIEPARTEISRVVNTEQINSLPISGGLFTDFALLSPGVMTGRISLQATLVEPPVTHISFAGQRDLNNGVTVDGADDSTATGLQRAAPPLGAVSEFRVVNSSFGAPYGRVLGGITNIATKSGTNDFHGSIYEYFQNNAIDANSPVAAPGFTVLRQNYFGASLGGPIVKDRTFFFASYEGQRRAQSPIVPAVFFSPVDNFVSALFPPGYTNLQAINAVKASFGLEPENLNVLQTGDVDNGIIKVDRQFNFANRLSTRYSIQDATNLNMLVGQPLEGGGVGAPSDGRNGLLRDQALAGNWTSRINAMLINSALVQWARRNYGVPGVTGQPNLDVPNLLLFGHNFAAFDRYNETRLQFADTLSLVKGNHAAAFGFETNYIRNFVIWPGFTPSRDVFPSLDDLLASGRLYTVAPGSGWGSTPCPPPFLGLMAPCIAAFFWGAPIGSGPFDPTVSSPSVPTTWENAYLPSEAKNFYAYLNHSYYGFFAQDQWRLTPKLTLSYGMRYDFETGLSFLINPDYREIQPRVGIAYSPNSKTVMRAGYGIFHDKYVLSPFFASPRPPIIPGLPTNNNQQAGTWLVNTLVLPTPCVLPGCPSPPSLFPFPSGTVPPPLIDSAFETLITSGSFPVNSLYAQGGTLVDRHMRAPYSEHLSLGIDHQIGKGLTASIGYLWVAAHKLARPIDLNVAPHIGQETGTNRFIYAYAIPVANIPAPPGGSPGTNGTFYYIDSTGNSAYNGMVLQVKESVGQSFWLGASYTFSKTLDDGTYVTFISTPQSNDQRNLERALSNQDVRHRFVANFNVDAPRQSFLRNFELSSIVAVQSPRPFTMFVGFDANNDGNPFTDRVGTMPRNAYFGDNLRSWDLRVSRMINFARERYRLQLMVDAFNVLNRANIDEVYSVYGTYDICGGLVPHHYRDGASLAIGRLQVGGCPVGGPPVPDPSFGTPRTAFNPRQFQFGAKLMF